MSPKLALGSQNIARGYYWGSYRSTRSSLVWIGACSADVHGSAGCIHVWAVSIGGVGRASDVGQAGVVGDIPDRLYEFVRSAGTSSVAAAGYISAAVEQELD